MSHGRCRYVSDFYQQAVGGHHFSPTYQQKLDNYPTLYGKSLGEFGRIAHASPNTKMIIKTNNLMGFSSKRS